MKNTGVFQVLVGDSVKEDVGGLETLGVGEIGIFDVATNSAIITAGLADASSEIFIGVGTDAEGTGSATDINFSAGEKIDLKNVTSLTKKDYAAQVPMVIELSGIKGVLDTDFGIKIEFRNNEIYRRQGVVQFTKNYSTYTGCCTDGCDACEECTPELVRTVLLGLADSINGDEDGLATAVVKTLISTTVGEVTTTVDTVIDASTTLTDEQLNAARLVITSVPAAINKYTGINMKYYSPRATVMLPSFSQGFECAGSFATVQEPVMSSGLGYDVQQLEYAAGGWNGNPGVYRTNAVTGLAQDITYFADKTETYTLITLEYSTMGLGGLQVTRDDMSTIIAIKSSETDAIDELYSVLEALIEG